MSRYFLVLIVCLIYNCANGQQVVQRVYTDFSVTRIIKSNDGGYLLAGTHDVSLWQNNAIISKIDSIGQRIWTKAFEDTIGFHNLIDIIATSDQNYLAVFLTNTSNPIKLIKFNNNGDILTTTHYISNSIYSLRGVFEAENGNIIAYGFVLSTSIFSGPVDFFIMKTDSNLNVIWAKQINYKYQSQFIRGILLSDGSYLFQGTAFDTTTTPTRNDLVLAKTDTAGNFIWFKQSGNYQVGSGMGNGPAVVTNYGDITEKNGSIYNAFNVSWFSNFYQYDVIIQKLDLNGNEIVAHQYGNDAGGTHDTRTIACTNFNEILFSTNGHLVKTDENLNFIWAKRNHPNQQQISIFNSLTISDSNYIGVLNYTNLPHSNSLLVKTDTSGEISCKNVPNAPLFNQQCIIGSFDKMNLITSNNVSINVVGVFHQSQNYTLINDSLQCLTSTNFEDEFSKQNTIIALHNHIVTDFLRVLYLSNDYSKSQLFIYSVSGNLILKMEILPQPINNISLLELPSGLYTLIFKNKNYFQALKFVKI